MVRIQSPSVAVAVRHGCGIMEPPAATPQAKMTIQTWELLSYIVTVVGLPLAIFVFAFEQRKQRVNEEDEIHQMLADSYSDFLKLVIDNADLRLQSSRTPPVFDAGQQERVMALYAILISIFERAYLMTYSPGQTDRRARYWNSWDDLAREWCQRSDFRAHLPTLLIGEDPAFAGYMRATAEQAAKEYAGEENSSP